MTRSGSARPRSGWCYPCRWIVWMALLKLAAGEDVEATVIGSFGTSNRELVLNYHGSEVGRMSMHFLHDGIPMPTRKAVVVPTPPRRISTAGTGDFKQFLLGHLAHPNVASKHWIIRQYDHEVQGGSVIKPLTGPLQIGPSDASVVRPKLTGHRGIAIGCGLTPGITIRTRWRSPPSTRRSAMSSASARTMAGSRSWIIFAGPAWTMN